MAKAVKTSSKKAAPKKTNKNKVSDFFYAWKKDFRGRWQKNPSLYTLGATVLVVVIVLVLLFWYNKGLFLAGNISGKLITTPQFYSKLTKANGEEVFDSMIRETLIKQEAAKKEIVASEKEINEKIKELEDRFGGKENFELALKQNNTSIEDLKQQITIQILVEKLLEDKIKVSDKDVSKYRTENKEAASALTDAQIKETLKSQKLSQEFTTWFEKLKEEANISTYF